jgi:hypothetical protein
MADNEPVPDTHLTDLMRFDTLIRTLKGLPPVEENVQTIKQFCKLLASYNVYMIHGSYDGSGDSGDMDISIQWQNKTEQPVGHTAPAYGDQAPSNGGAWDSLSSARKRLTEVKDAIITNKMVDDFEDAMFQLIPGGWEINDGSFGEIDVTVATGAIEVTHNERYTEVNTSHREY